MLIFWWGCCTLNSDDLRMSKHLSPIKGISRAPTNHHSNWEPITVIKIHMEFSLIIRSCSNFLFIYRCQPPPSPGAAWVCFPPKHHDLLHLKVMGKACSKEGKEHHYHIQGWRLPQAWGLIQECPQGVIPRRNEKQPKCSQWSMLRGGHCRNALCPPSGSSGQETFQAPVTMWSRVKELAPAFRAVTCQEPTGRLAAQEPGQLSSLPGARHSRGCWAGAEEMEQGSSAKIPCSEANILFFIYFFF